VPGKIGTGDHDMLYCDEKKESTVNVEIICRHLGSPVTANRCSPCDVLQGVRIEWLGACSCVLKYDGA
jgi:hypothetical protein